MQCFILFEGFIIVGPAFVSTLVIENVLNIILFMFGRLFLILMDSRIYNSFWLIFFGVIGEDFSYLM